MKQSLRPSPAIALVVAFSATLATMVAAPVRGDVRETEAQACQHVLDALGVFSPANPDPKDLAAFVKLRDTLPEGELRNLFDNFVATGFVAGRREDLCNSLAKPSLTAATPFLEPAKIQCQNCQGTGNLSKTCLKCGGDGRCQICKGSGTRRVNAAIYTMKGPVKITKRQNAEGQDAYRDIECDTCGGTGECQTCKGNKVVEATCPSCHGTGEAWNNEVARQLSVKAHGQLSTALRLRVFRGMIPDSLVEVKIDSGTASGPVFMFKGRKVVAVAAHAIVESSGIFLFTPNRQAIPFSGFFADSTRDLVLIDIGETSLVTPLELENDAGNLEARAPIYALGVSRDGGTPMGLLGEVTSLARTRISTDMKSTPLSSGAALLTAKGKLGGILVDNLLEANAAGQMISVDDKGIAVRLDNLYPSSLTEVKTDDLRNLNAILSSARKTIGGASDLLALGSEEVIARRNVFADAIQRLDKARSAIAEIRQWPVFSMGKTAMDLSEKADVIKGRLETRLRQPVETAVADNQPMPQAPIADYETGPGKTRTDTAKMALFILCACVLVVAIVSAAIKSRHAEEKIEELTAIVKRKQDDGNGPECERDEGSGVSLKRTRTRVALDPARNHRNSQGGL